MSDEKNLVVFNEEEIEQSKQLAGQTDKMSIPFIPIITVNNKSQKKEATIDGVKQEVEIPAKQGFNILKKNDGEYSNEFLAGDISGIILKERYQIEKKYVPGSKEVQYKSYEFDGWNDQVTLFDSFTKKILFQGTYKQLKEEFSKTNEQGKITRDYSLFVVLYINLEGLGDIYRLKVKITGGGEWFDYKNSFKSEPWAGYITHFKLLQKVVGDIKFWYLTFERGEQVNLSEQLVLQKELNKFFQVTYTKKEEQKVEDKTEPIYLNDNDSQVIDNFEDPADGLDVSQIPF